MDGIKWLTRLLLTGMIIGVAISVFGAFWLLQDFISLLYYYSVTPPRDFTFLDYLVMVIQNPGGFALLTGGGLMALFFFLVIFLFIYRRGFDAIYKVLQKKPDEMTEEERADTKRERRLASLMAWGLILSLVVILAGLILSPLGSLGGTSSNWLLNIVSVLIYFAYMPPVGWLGLDILIIGIVILVAFLAIAALVLLVRYGHRFFLKFFFKLNK